MHGVGGLGISLQHVLGLGEVEGSLALDHLVAGSGRVADPLHGRLSLRDGIALRKDGGRPDRQDSADNNQTDHERPSLKLDHTASTYLSEQPRQAKSKLRH